MHAFWLTIGYFSIAVVIAYFLERVVLMDEDLNEQTLMILGAFFWGPVLVGLIVFGPTWVKRQIKKQPLQTLMRLT